MVINSQSHSKTVIKITDTSGVYFLKIAGQIVYIGKSINVFSRIFGIDHMAKRYDEVEIHWMPADQIAAYEKTQIAIHKPSLNVEGVKPRKASRTPITY